MAQEWFLVLVVFMVVFAAFSEYAQGAVRPFWSGATITFVELWAAINIWVAFLHYAYDGMIWKLRRPETARSLGVEIKAS